MNTDPRLELKSFAFQVEQMRMAQTRYFELSARAKKSKKPEDFNNAKNVLEMCKQLEVAVDDSIREFNKNNNIRIAPEQVTADSDFKTALENNLSAWRAELEQVQNQQIEQALIDAKEGHKSARYNALEKREADLKTMIAEANEKMGSVQGRIQSPSFSSAVNQIVNEAKP